MSDVTLGIIGSGQLGMMLCQAARKLKVKTVVISDDEEGPAQNYADQFIHAKYDNRKKTEEFIGKVDVVTFEFENIQPDSVIHTNIRATPVTYTCLLIMYAK